MSELPEYISLKTKENGDQVWFDRRVVEVDWQGEVFLRDPVTRKRYRVKTGAMLDGNENHETQSQ